MSDITQCNVDLKMDLNSVMGENTVLGHDDGTHFRRDNGDDGRQMVIHVETVAETRDEQKAAPMCNENTLEKTDEHKVALMHEETTEGNSDEQKGIDPGAEFTVEEKFSSAVAGKEIRNSVVLPISFLCVFASYMAIQSLQGSLNDEAGLGVISLSCVYGANFISCLIAPWIAKRVGVKRVIIAAFCVHFIYATCNFYPSFATLVPSSLLLGAVTGPLWTCQGIYLTTCAFSYAQETGIQVFAALSRINGIFWAVFDLSNIIGSLVSSSVLYQSKYNISETNQSDYCGINDCPLAETADIIADPELLVIYILLGIFLFCVFGGILTSFIFLTPIQSQGKITKISVRYLFIPLFKMIARTDMKYLIPLTIYLAIAKEIMVAEITKSYVSCPIGIQNIGYVLTAYGVSTSAASFVFSRLAKYTTRYILLSLAGAIHTALLGWIFNWIPTGEDTIKIYILISIWGIADGLWKTQYSSLLGKHFADDIDCVFSAAEGMRAIGFTATFVYSSLLCMYVKLSIAISFLAVGMALYYFVEIRFIRRTRRNEDKEMSDHM